MEPVLGLGWPSLAGLTLATIVAGVIRGFTGFGAALVMAPAFVLVVDARESIVLITLLNLITMTQLLPPAVRQADWRVVVPMSLAACLCLPLGTWLLLAVDGDVLRRAIALIVGAFGLVLLVGWHPDVRPRRALSGAVGAASGVLTGLGGIGGPPVVLYLLSGPSAAARDRASFISYFAIVQGVGLVPLALAGLIAREHVVLALALTPAYFAATWIGARLFARARDDLYKRVAIGVLLAIALAAFLA